MYYSDRRVVLLGCVLFVVRTICIADGTVIPQSVIEIIDKINSNGALLGVVVPNSFELSPLLQSSSFLLDHHQPHLDFAGRRFRLGRVGDQRVVVVMTGLSMLNAGITTTLLLTLFRIKGVVHFGIAGNANPKLQIGDVAIPQSWAHTGLWNWQRNGDGPNDELALEINGDYTRTIGYLNFSDYSVNSSSGNTLNSVWYQPEEIFSEDGTPEVRQHAFWVPVNRHYFSLAKKLENMKLEGCINSTTCLPRAPVVATVERGISGNVFVDNKAYREFLNSKFNATPIDMESAAVALVCLQRRTPFIAIRALSDLAGGGSSQSNEADLFAPLAASNAVDVALRFISLLSS